MYYQKKRKRASLAKANFTIGEYFARQMVERGVTVEQFNKLLGIKRKK